MIKSTAGQRRTDATKLDIAPGYLAFTLLSVYSSSEAFIASAGSYRHGSRAKRLKADSVFFANFSDDRSKDMNTRRFKDLFLAVKVDHGRVIAAKKEFAYAPMLVFLRLGTTPLAELDEVSEPAKRSEHALLKDRACGKSLNST
jgi:hypothetical protein